MQLSEFAVRKAKPKARPYRLSDGGGLHLLVQPGGSKLWQVRYRHAGKANFVSLGPYPLVFVTAGAKVGQCSGGVVLFAPE